MSPLSPADVLRRVHGDLAKWGKEHKARVVLAPDPLLAMEALFSAPGNLVCAVWWNGDEPAEDATEDLVVLTHEVRVAVGFSVPPTAKPNERLVEASGPRAALLDRVAEVRERVRSMLMPEDVTGRWWRYQGCEPVEVDGVPMAAYRLGFALDAAAPDVEPRDVI